MAKVYRVTKEQAEIIRITDISFRDAMHQYKISNSLVRKIKKGLIDEVVKVEKPEFKYFDKERIAQQKLKQQQKNQTQTHEDI